MIWIPIFIFIIGLAIGSFLNVCIYRIPRSDVSIYSPRRSFCPACNQSIKFYDNIPLLSYLILRGKCRHCKAKISVLYPVVELVTAVLFLVMYYNFEITLELMLALVFIVVLIPIFVIDAQHTIIPTVIVWTGLIIGLVIVWSYFVSTCRYLVPDNATNRCFCWSCNLLVDCGGWENDL